MYVPSDDTFLLADCIMQYRGKRALEIGVGSGMLLQVLEKNFQDVAGSDISLQALQHAAGVGQEVRIIEAGREVIRVTKETTHRSGYPQGDYAHILSLDNCEIAH